MQNVYRLVLVTKAGPNTIQPMLPSPRPLTPKRQKLQENGPFKTLAL